MGTSGDILVKLEDYLTNVLNKENLSVTAEEVRLKLIEEIEVSRLPPSLPPRQEGKLEINGIAEQRDKSRKNYSNPVKPLQLNLEIEEDYPGEEYADVDPPDDSQEGVVNGDAEPATPGLYEEPQKMPPHLTAPDPVQSDYDSGTSYETYDEDEGSDEGADSPRKANSESIQLPRVKSKKRRKKAQPEKPISSLQNVMFKGELYQRSGLLQTFSKRLCFISDDNLVVYKSDSDSKPTLTFSLLGYEANYMKKDGKYCHVLKLAKTGEDAHWLFSDNKDVASLFLQHLTTSCAGRSPPATSNSDNISLTESQLSSKDSSEIQLAADISSSEGGSADGVVTTPDTKATAKKMKTVAQSIGDKIKTTIGRKKGKGVAEALFEEDPDVQLAGNAMVMSETLIGSKKWINCFCVVKNNTLECYKERGSETHDFCMALKGVEIQLGNLSGKYELAVKLVQDGKTKLHLLPKSTLEHGQWLNVLIKETESASPRKQQFDETADTEEGAYSDVYDHRQPLTFKDSSRDSPPPLPTSPPPASTPPSVKRIFESTTPEDLDPENTYDDVLLNRETEDSPTDPESLKLDLSNDKAEDTAGQAEEEVDAQDVGGVIYDDVADENVPKKQVGEIINRIKRRLTESATPPYMTVLENAKAEMVESTAKDKVLLEGSQNPILSELKKKKVPTATLR